MSSSHARVLAFTTVQRVLLQTALIVGFVFVLCSLAVLPAFAQEAGLLPPLPAEPLIGPAPEVSFSVSPASVPQGNAALLTWGSTFADVCTGTLFDTLNATSGSVSVTPYETTSYGITCGGMGGNTTAETLLTVTTADLTLSATASVVPQTGVAPLTVSLTAAATGGTGSYSYAWSFGDGTANSSEQNPTHVYQSAGTYTATLTVTSGTQTDTDSVTVTVSAPALPTADVNANPTSLTRGAASIISWTSTNATACLGTNFTTNSQTSGSVSVSPTETTTYTLACTGAGGTATDTVTVTVTDAALSASASVVPNSGTAPLTVSFTAAATGGTGTYSYSWSFGDNTTNSSEQNPTHVYQTAGTYTATLTVTSGTQTDTDSVTVTVTAPQTSTNLLTNASFETANDWTGGFWTSSKGTIARVTNEKKSGSYSYMIDGLTTSSAGQVYSAGANQVAVTPGKEYTFSTWYKGSNAYILIKWFNSAGVDLKIYPTVALPAATTWAEGTVKAAAPANAARAWVFVQSRNNANPVYFDDVWFGTGEGTVQTPIADLSASSNSIAKGGSVTLSWTSSYTTSCAGTNFTTNSQTSGSVSVSPTETTTYTLACTGAGGTATDTVTVTVTDAALSASASVVPNSGTAPLTVSFTAAATGGTGSYTYSWSFGDGTANSTEQNPTHTYQSAGTYTATLTVTSGTQTDTDSVSVTVSAPTSTSTPTNLLTNASFETANDWTGGFWTSSKGTIARVTNEKKSGSYSYMIDGDSSSSAGQVYSSGVNRVAVTPGKEYTFKAWYKGSNAYILIKWFNSAGTQLSTVPTQTLPAASAWTEGTLKATAPANAARAWVFVQSRNNASPVYFDDLSLSAQ